MTLFDYAGKKNRLDLLLEWDRTANRDLDPKIVQASALDKAAWVCEKGHRWTASIKTRTDRKTGCPYCAGQKAIPGENDFATTYPQLVGLWHSTKNGSFTPQNTMPMSHRSVWWRCERGHEWKAQVQAVTKGCGCPYCSGYRPIRGETDLATTHPELVAEWDYEKNELTPQDVSKGMSKAMWWKCSLGHSYRQKIYSRIAGNGCPYCSGNKVLAGFNDLATTNPEMLLDWDYEKNKIEPTAINRGSHRKLWWKCEKGHSYDAEPYARAAGNGCPYCAGRKVMAGFNDLATTHPKVAAQWDYDLNGGLTPQMVTKGSNKKAWFRCSEGHVWETYIFSRTRTRASDCPVCAGKTKTKHKEHFTLEKKPTKSSGRISPPRAGNGTPINYI